MKSSSIKLQSLPEDLRREADRLIAAKFPAPKTPKPTAPKSEPEVLRGVRPESIIYDSYIDEAQQQRHILDDWSLREVDKLYQILHDPNAPARYAMLYFIFDVPMGLYPHRGYSFHGSLTRKTWQHTLTVTPELPVEQLEYKLAYAYVHMAQGYNITELYGRCHLKEWQIMPY